MATYVSLKDGSTLSHTEIQEPLCRSDGSLGLFTPTVSPVYHTGKPASKPLASWKDLGTLVMVLSSCAGAIGAVMSHRAAVYLGQTYQLVVIGACLAFMAMGCNRQVSNTFILYSVHSGRATLQNLEAILQRDITIAKSSVLCRALVFALTLVPLLLSVSYKTCVGGSSSVKSHIEGGEFGLTGRPGHQNLGLGFSLIAETFLPFWIDPKTSATYGFNLLVQSNSTAALLDAPLPTLSVSLQRSLAKDEALIMTTTVNATVAEAIPISQQRRDNATYWQDLQSQFGLTHWLDLDMGFSHHCFFAMGIGNDEQGRNNYSTAFVSSYWTDRGQSLASEARQVSLSRRECKATWQITRSNIMLVDGQVLETESEARTRHNQSLVDGGVFEIAGLFGTLVTEYDWAPWAPRDLNNVNTVPSMVATMLWARQVAISGREWEEADPYQDAFHVWGLLNAYSKRSPDLDIFRERTSLKRNGLLLFTLLALPTITIVAFCMKLWLYDCPVDDGFGLISLLAAVQPRSLGVVQGAGLSGQLNRSIPVRFGIRTTDDQRLGRTRDGIQIHLDETQSGRTPKMQPGKLYE